MPSPPGKARTRSGLAELSMRLLRSMPAPWSMVPFYLVQWAGKARQGMRRRRA